MKSFCMCVLFGTYPYPVSVSDFTDFFKNRHNSIKLCWNKSKKMPRLNNDERNKAIGVLNAGTLVTVVLRHFGCTRKTIEHLWRRFVSQKTLPTVLKVVGHVWPLLPMIATSSCSTYLTGVWLQQQLEDSMVFMHRLSEIGWDKTFTIYAYWPYFGQILTQAHRTARQDWCSCHLYFWCADWYLILFCNDCQFNLRHAVWRERIYHRRGRAFCQCGHHWAGLIRRWFSLSLQWDNILRYVNSMCHRITACIAQNGRHMRYWHISLNLQSLFVSW